MSLFRSAPGFMAVAVQAGGYYVFPNMRPSLMLGVNMVYGQFQIFASAVLAGVFVTAEYLSPVQFGAERRVFYEAG
jgi:hypothetical protein